jgi:hypothetical protein
MTSTKVLIHVFLREEESIAYSDKISKKVMTELSKLNFEGLQGLSHTSETNHISINLNDKKNLTRKVKKMERIEEIGYFILWTYPKQEILDAIADHDYFKAFALSSTFYEYFGKALLINYISNKKVPVNPKKIRGLQMDDIIKKLHNYKLISKSLKSDMNEVNKIRIYFIHFKFFRQIAKTDFEKIAQGIPKIKRSINKLEKLYEQSY